VHVTLRKVFLSWSHTRPLGYSYLIFQIFSILSTEISRNTSSTKTCISKLLTNKRQFEWCYFSLREFDRNGERAVIKTSRRVHRWIWIKSRRISRFEVSWSLLCSLKSMSVSLFLVLSRFFSPEMKTNRVDESDEHNET